MPGGNQDAIIIVEVLNRNHVVQANGEKKGLGSNNVTKKNIKSYIHAGSQNIKLVFFSIEGFFQLLFELSKTVKKFFEHIGSRKNFLVDDNHYLLLKK